MWALCVIAYFMWFGGGANDKTIYPSEGVCFLWSADELGVPERNGQLPRPETVRLQTVMHLQ